VQITTCNLWVEAGTWGLYLKLQKVLQEQGFHVSSGIPGLYVFGMGREKGVLARL
jgi:hypothetical protein